MTPTSVAPTHLTLDSISPRLGARFSPNLHSFLRSVKQRTNLVFGRVYKDMSGQLWLGICADGMFIGARLTAVLCNGAKTVSMAYPGLVGNLVEVDGFWDRYCSVGRCAIDTQHKTYFIGDDTRWSVKGDKRECMWCGDATQTLRKETESVECTEWA